MKLFVAFSRAYPAQSALVLGSLVLASLFEPTSFVRAQGDIACWAPSASRRRSACCC